MRRALWLHSSPTPWRRRGRLPWIAEGPFQYSATYYWPTNEGRQLGPNGRLGCAVAESAMAWPFPRVLDGRPRGEAFEVVVMVFTLVASRLRPVGGRGRMQSPTRR